MGFRRLVGRMLATTPAPEIILRRRSARRVAVMGYHRIMPPPPPPPGAQYPFNRDVISATPEEFARELRYLRANFDVISMPELLAGLRRPALLPPRPAVITFDDGYVDNYTCAFPLLREAGAPACFFLCTALIGTRRVAWQEAWVCCLQMSRASKIQSPFGGDDPPYELDPANFPASRRRFRRNALRLPWKQVPSMLQRLRETTSVEPEQYLTTPLFMTWDNVREMADAGMDIGGHTREHPALATVDQAALDDQVGGCFQDLRRALGRRPLAFAYPFGTPEVMSARADEAIRLAGFEICFSFVHGYARRLGGGLSRLPRIHAVFGDDQKDFRLRMAMAPDVA